MNYKSFTNLFQEINYQLMSDKKKFINMLSFNTTNYGDFFNRILLEQLLGKKVHIVDINLYNRLKLSKLYDKIDLTVGIGSILHFATKDSVVWGTGSVYYNSIPKIQPKEILAIRGLLTGKNLKSNGYKFNEIYGDPGILAAKFSQNLKISEDKKYKLGIIPHFTEHNCSVLDSIRNNEEILIVDISNTKSFLEQLTSCETIASSSLHGLVFADSFQIPNVWIKLSNKIHGGDFKYLDYYSGLLNTTEINFNPLEFSDKIDIKLTLKSCWKKENHIDMNKLSDSLIDYFKSNNL